MKLGNTVIRTIQGDITKLINVEAIVNSANNSLLGGGGLDGAIHRAAGPGLLEECRGLKGCRTGGARITGAYNLPNRYVIHTVGPVWRGGNDHEAQLLADCYRNSLGLAVSRGIRSLAFPTISTGRNGFPVDQAADIAVRTVVDFVRDHPGRLDEVMWVFSNAGLKASYDQLLSRMEAGSPESRPSGVKPGEIRSYEPLWGSWYVEEKIGQGSFGKVYKVSRTSLNKKFISAVKMISIPGSAGEIDACRKKGMSEELIRSYYRKKVERLEQEIILMEEMKGASNILSIEDFMIAPHVDPSGRKTIGYDVLIRMEYLQSMEDFLSGKTPDEKEVVKMGIDLCKALEHCEKYHIIHRDIKPENVFRNKFGEYKLGDFGISRQMDQTAHATNTGTPLYMAPEIFRFEEYNQNVDLYSLGLMMYQLLNKNRLPFMPEYPEEIWPEDTELAMKKRLSGRPLPKINGVSDGLMRILLKASAFRKEDRYRNASQMKKELINYGNK